MGSNGDFLHFQQNKNIFLLYKIESVVIYQIIAKVLELLFTAILIIYAIS